MPVKSWLSFIFSHSIFISFCAAALCYQTYTLLQLRHNPFVYLLLFFSTLGSYNFYWLISKYHFTKTLPLTLFLKRNISNTILFVFASTGLLYSIMNLDNIFVCLLIAVLLTLLYSLPLWPFKKLKFATKPGFLKTVLLALTWTYVTVIIPARQVLFVDSPAILLLFFGRFLFMLMLCIIFDSRDVEVDKIHSLRSLATDVSPDTLKKIMITVFCLYVVLGFILRFYFTDAAQVAALLITAGVSFLVYVLSLKKQGYLFYYFLVDGLMLFSALTTFLATI